jgi:hypothetical protein
MPQSEYEQEKKEKAAPAQTHPERLPIHTNYHTLTYPNKVQALGN